MKNFINLIGRLREGSHEKQNTRWHGGAREAREWRESGAREAREWRESGDGGWCNHSATIQQPFSNHSATIEHPLQVGGNKEASPMRFLRYVAMLAAMLMLGVGQMWGAIGGSATTTFTCGTTSAGFDFVYTFDSNGANSDTIVFSGALLYNSSATYAYKVTGSSTPSTTNGDFTPFVYNAAAGTSLTSAKNGIYKSGSSNPAKLVLKSPASIFIKVTNCEGVIVSGKSSSNSDCIVLSVYNSDLSSRLDSVKTLKNSDGTEKITGLTAANTYYIQIRHTSSSSNGYVYDIGLIYPHASSCDATIPGNISKGEPSEGTLRLTAAGSAETGDTWYWQASSTGTSKSESGATKDVTAAGTYYIRSYNTSGDCWSDAKSVTVDAADLLTAPTATFTNSTYAIGGSSLDLSSLFSSNSEGAVTYSVDDAAGTGASVSTAAFSATRAGKAKVKAVQAANGDYAAITKYAYITVGSNATGKHTLTWDLEVNVNKSGIPVTDSVRSTSLYLTTVEGDTLKGTGLSYSGGDAKSGLTEKISAPAAYDGDKYVYVQFTIADGYTFTPDSAWCIVQAVGNGSNQNGKIVLSDNNSHTINGEVISCPGTKAGSPTHVVVKNGSSTALSGTVTMKIYVYGTEATYRLGEKINIHGSLAVDEPAAESTNVYLKPNGIWNKDGARYAAYYFKNDDNTDNGWVDMTEYNACTPCYKAEIPSGYDKVIFCRMDGAEEENSWDNRWDQTLNLDVPTGNDTCYTISSINGCTDGKSCGSWGTYTAPSYTMTYNGNGNTGGEVPTDENSYACGDDVTVLDNTGSLVKSGYSFACWSTAAGSGTDYFAEDTYEISSNATLYAKWTQLFPSSVSVDGTWRRFAGQTISLMATPSGGDENEQSPKWQKWNGSAWADIDGATDWTYSKASCTVSDGGRYRCVVTTDGVVVKSCADDAEGYVVRIYVLMGGYSNSSWSTTTLAAADDNTTAGSTTISLLSDSLYQFKVAGVAHDTTWFGNNGYMLKSESSWACTGSGGNIRVFTGAAGTFTFAVDIDHLTYGTPEVVTSVTYPTVSHPAAGFVYFDKSNYGWENVAAHWYKESGPTDFVAWNSNPWMTQTATICGTSYYYMPVLPGYDRLIFHNAGGDGQGGTITVTSSSSGKYIVKDGTTWNAFTTYSITYAKNGADGGTDMTNVNGICPGADCSLAENTWTKTGYAFSHWTADVDVTVSSATVSAGELIDDETTLESISSNITLTAQWQCNAPEISFNSGTKTVTISGITGATVYYTTDGEDPTEESDEYIGAFTIDETLTIKAIAVQDGYVTSEVASQSCTPCSDAGLAYATNSVAKTYGDSKFTNTLTNSHSVTIVGYESSNPDVATVDEDGEVTIVGAGSATITASSEVETVSTVEYCADEASYTLNVAKAAISPSLSYASVGGTSLEAGESSSGSPTVSGNSGSGSVTYAVTSASPAGCITVNSSTGVVTAVAQGTATVTATIGATDNYLGNTATANFTISACEAVNASIVFDNNKAAKYNTAYNTSTDIVASGSATYSLSSNCSSDAAHPMTKPAIKGEKNKTLIQLNIPEAATSGTISVSACTYSGGAATLAITNSSGDVLASGSLKDYTINSPDGGSWTAPTLRTISYDITAGGTYYIKETSNSNNVYIYAFSATGEKTCPCETPDEPTNVSATAVTHNSVTLSITDDADAASYDIYCATGSTAPTGSTTPTTNSESKTPTVSGLTANTEYYAWVRAVCDEDHVSDWVALDDDTFTTDKDPATKFGLKGSTDVCGEGTATITMTGSQSGVSYQLYKNGEADEDEDPKAGTGSALTWSGKTAGTYTVWSVENSTYAATQMDKTDSTTVTVTLLTAPEITDITGTGTPKAIAAYTNIATSLTVTATGDNLNYQWQTCSDDEGADAADLTSGSEYSGFTAATLNLTATSTGTRYFRCKVYNTCDAVYSDVVTVTIGTSYQLTYAANGGTGAPSATYEAPGSITLSSTVPTTVTKDSVFMGWNTAADGTGDMYQPGDAFTMPSAATTLTAQWNNSPCFKIDNASKSNDNWGGDKSNGDEITSVMINGTITGGSLYYTGSGSLGGNKTDGLVIKPTTHELTVYLASGILQEGTVIEIGGKSMAESKTFGFEISGNAASPVFEASGSKTAFTQRYVVSAEDELVDKDNFTIKQLSSATGSQTYLYSIKVAGCGSCTGITPTLTYSGKTVDTLYVYTGMPHVTPSRSFTKDGNTSAPIFSSSDENVVTVSAAGFVTAVGAGSAVVTMTLPYDGTHCSGSVSRNFDVPALVTQAINVGSSTPWGTPSDLVFAHADKGLTQSAVIANTGYDFTTTNNGSANGGGTTDIFKGANGAKSDSKYLSLSFTSTHPIRMGEVVVPIYAVDKKLVAKVEVSDGTTTVTSDESDSLAVGTLTQARFKLDINKALKAGTITVKIFVYGQASDQGFRLGTPIRVDGAVMDEKLTFEPSYTSGYWSSINNWNHGFLPTINDSIIIKKTCNVDIPTAKAKNIQIDKTASSDICIRIDDWHGGLVVAESITAKHEGDADFGPTTKEDIMIQTSILGNGGLIIGGASNNTQASYDFYTKAYKFNTFYINQYIGIPFEEVNVHQYNDFRVFVYDRDSDAWATPENETLQPWTAYNMIRRYSGGTWNQFTLNGTLNLPGLSTSTPLNCGWRNAEDFPGGVLPVSIDTIAGHQDYMFANSWTAPISIADMDASDCSGEEGADLVHTIYIFNAGYVPNDGSNQPKELGDFAGQWSSFPLGSSKYMENAVIPATQAFAVTAKAEGATLTLDYKKHVYDPAIAADSVCSFGTRAPRRDRSYVYAPSILKVIVRCDSAIADQLYVFEREDFTNNFDNGWDGNKKFGKATMPQLYAIQDGGKMAVSAVPEMDGTQIGFKAGTKANAYTFTFDYDENGEELYLYDKVTSEYTRIENGGTYTFTTNDNDEHVRFILTRNTYLTPTGIEDIQGGDVQDTKAEKFIKNEHLYIQRGGVLYDATGKRVK